MEHLPQYMIDHIVMAVKTAMSDYSPALTQSVANTIRQELTSPASMVRFDGLLERYHKSTAEMTSRFEEFNRNILQNQSQMQSLLQQIIENGGGDCSNTEDIMDVKKWLDELLNGDDYKLKQQTRDLLESGFARSYRNIVATYVVVTAILGILGLIGGYFAMTSAVKDAVSTIQNSSSPQSDSSPSKKTILQKGGGDVSPRP